MTAVLTQSIASELMVALLAGDHPALNTLRTQYAASSPGQLELSGVGFFLPFAVPPGTDPASPLTFQLTDIAFDLKNVPEGGSVILFVKNGYLAVLEVYLWSEEWPTEPVLASWTYLL